MKRSISAQVITLLIGLVGIITIEHWMPYWIGFWEYVAIIALKALEVSLQ